MSSFLKKIISSLFKPKKSWVFVQNFSPESDRTHLMFLNYQNQGIEYDIRPPQATQKYSVDELLAMRLSGLYIFK